VYREVTDMLLVDGDMFASFHHVYHSSQDPGRMFVDIWRVKDGRISEHWDVKQTVPEVSRNDHRMW
jgi:predicted SnoaL-like aldol condensation-catalyzing enzyme